MSNEIKFKEIVYCNLTILHKGKKHLLEEVVYKKEDGFYYNQRILNTLNIKEKVKVLDVEIIKRLGFENKSKGFTEVKKNEETRNKITGTYE